MSAPQPALPAPWGAGTPAHAGASSPGRRLRLVLAGALAALLVACGTTPQGGPYGGGNVSRLPPGNAQRDGPEAHPPANLEAVPDAVPQIEPLRIGGPNKPYEIGGHTYVPLTDDRPVTETGLASWYGKKFHGRRTASGETYNMYAMTAAHKTLPIPSYARVRNPANGHEVIVRVNDRGPFANGRIVDLSYTAALKLGVLGGVQPVEITRITDEDIRSGAAFRAAPTLATAVNPAAPLPRAAGNEAQSTRAGVAAAGGAAAGSSSTAPTGAPVGAAASAPESSAAGAAPAVLALASGGTARSDAGSDSSASPASGAGIAQGIPAPFAPAAAPLSGRPATTAQAADELARADTTAGVGFWLQLGAYRQRDGALDFQRRLIDEQPWLAPLLAVVPDHGLNKLQAGPYGSRDDAKNAAERIRIALQLVPTIVEKR
jgi:rare lipoprotein A